MTKGTNCHIRRVTMVVFKLWPKVYTSTGDCEKEAITVITEYTVNIGSLCTLCGRDTSLRSGLFVNRIPSGGFNATLVLDTGSKIDVTLDGYMCIECQEEEEKEIDFT
jgi:hypothetical protein